LPYSLISDSGGFRHTPFGHACWPMSLTNTHPPRSLHSMPASSRTPFRKTWL